MLWEKSFLGVIKIISCFSDRHMHSSKLYEQGY